MPRLLHDDFELDAFGACEATDPKAWRIHREDGNRVLDQHAASQYTPAVRSPLNYALAGDLDVEDFILDVKVKSTGRDVPQRDVCLILGYQDPKAFYYVHIAKKADQVHNNIFIVDNDPRSPIGETRTDGTPWTDGWHHVRLIRRVDDGLIQVFFDDMTTPIMTTHNKRFLHGRVGLGSFDDTAQFDSVQIWGKRVGK